MNQITIKPLVVLTILAALFGQIVAQATTTVTQPYIGITRIDRTETLARPVSMHIIQVDLTAPGIHFELTPAGGTRETNRQTTLNFLNQQNAQVAINSHFFLPFPSSDTTANVVGLAASAGNVYSGFESQPIATGYTNQNYAIVPFAPALNIDADNNAGIVHHDPSYTDNKHTLESVELYNALSGSAQIITNGIMTIPVYKDAAHPEGQLTSNSTYSNNNSWYSLARGRTAIGLTQDNKTLVLFTVDQAGGSGGMTPGEVADLLMNDYGVYNAINLDGGGSTTMAMQDPVTHIGSIINVSADNPLGRAVGSNFAVYAMVPEPATLCLFGIGVIISRTIRSGRRS